MKKKTLLFFVLTYTFILIPFLLTAETTKKKKALNWEVGTSTSLFKNYSLEEFQAAKEAGISYIELTPNDVKRKTPEEKKNYFDNVRKFVENARVNCQKTGLKVWSIHLPYGKDYDISLLDDSIRECNVNQNLQVMEICAILKPAKFVIHPSAEPIKEKREQRIVNCRKSLEVLNTKAKALNAQLLVEDLPRTCLASTTNEMIYLLSEVSPEIGVVFDTNHLLQGSTSEFAEKLGSRIKSLHISDYDGVDERHWLPGDGINDWMAILKHLDNAGYNGVFMFESRKRKDKSEVKFSQLTQCWSDLQKEYRSQNRK